MKRRNGVWGGRREEEEDVTSFQTRLEKMNIHSSWFGAHLDEIKVTFLDTENPLLELHTFTI